MKTTINTVETTVAASNETAGVEVPNTVAVNAVVNGMVEKEKSWINAANVAACASLITGAVTMVGKDKVDLGGALGCVAGTAAAYLATKWVSESIGLEEHGLGKAMGLFIGIDLGYALTNLGSQMYNERNTEANMSNYL